jgi:hypothetical protein
MHATRAFFADTNESPALQGKISRTCSRPHRTVGPGLYLALGRRWPRQHVPGRGQRHAGPGARLTGRHITSARPVTWS